MLLIGSAIGSGIYFTPGSVLRNVGGAIAPALLVWFAGGLLSLLGALTYGELGAMKPAAGAHYVYIRDCFGALPAFLFGWILFFVISGGSIATLAVAFSVYTGSLITLNPVETKLLSLVMIAIITVVNVLGVRKSSNLMNWATAVKVGCLAVMSAVLFWFGTGFNSAAGNIWPAKVDGSLASGFGVAMISVLWTYEGWQICSYSAGETVNPRKNIPRAFLAGSAAMIGIYLIANLAYLAALGPIAAAQSDSIAAAAMVAVMGPAAAKLVSLMIMVSLFSAANSIVLTTPRVFYMMAADGLFFKKLAEVHPRFRTPAFAVIMTAVWACVLTVSGTFEQLLTYVIFVGWAFYALAAASIFIYRKREPDAVRPYRVPGYPWTPLAFIVGAAAVVMNTIIAKPGNSALGIGVVALGTPAYFVWKSLIKRKPANEDAGDGS